MAKAKRKAKAKAKKTAKKSKAKATTTKRKKSSGDSSIANRISRLETIAKNHGKVINHHAGFIDRMANTLRQMNGKPRLANILSRDPNQVLPTKMAKPAKSAKSAKSAYEKAA